MAFVGVPSVLASLSPIHKTHQAPSFLSPAPSTSAISFDSHFRSKQLLQKLMTTFSSHHFLSVSMMASSQSSSDTPQLVQEPVQVLSFSQRLKLDGGPDLEFYDYPRMVYHVDSSFVSSLTALYAKLIPKGAKVLDLCGSWVSHLPNQGADYATVVGHGMNAEELSKNKALSGGYFVQDFNQSLSTTKGFNFKGTVVQVEQPQNPNGDNYFDAVVCCVSIQYMQKPELLMAHIHRVLKPGGICIISFSNRMFYTKAISAWRENTDAGRINLVKSYFTTNKGFTDIRVFDSAMAEDSARVFEKLTKALLNLTDPFIAVVATKAYV